MSQTVSAVFDPDLIVTLTDSDGVVSIPDRVVAGSAGFSTLRRTLANGTGPGKANKSWRKRSTLGAASNDDWVLSGGSNVVDRFSNVINFTKIKWVIIRLVAPVVGAKLTIGAAAANPWPAWFGNTNDVEDVQCLLIRMDDIDGYAVSANHTLRVRNPGASAVIYDIILLGEG